MLKVMIVDDEKIIRIGISSMINWHKLGLTLVGEAVNGAEGFDLFCQVKPDIIITDIRMPKVDGIEMMRRIKEISEQVKFVILTGYEDFSYAKKAIQLGVSEYLLKSDLMPEDIEALLERIISDIIATKDTKEIINHQTSWVSIQTVASDLCHGFRILNEEEISKTDANLFRQGYCCLVMGIKECGLKNLNTPNDGRLMIAETMIHERLAQFQMISFINNHLLGAILFLEEYQMREILTELDHCIRQLKEQHGFIVTIGISRQERQLTYVAAAYSQAGQAYDQRMFYGCGGVINGSEQQSLIELERKTYDLKVIEKAVACLDLDSLTDHLRQIFNILKKQQNYEEVNLVALDLFVLMNKISVNIYPDDILFERKKQLYQQLTCWEEIEEIEHWFQQEFRLLLDESSRQTVNRKNITGYLKQFIDEHYSQDITLQSLGQLVNLNKNYVGNLFKKDVGKSVNEYLLLVRIEHAKELLSQSNLKANVIANKVGYGDERYFYKLFKKVTGITTMDYIKQYRSQSEKKT